MKLEVKDGRSQKVEGKGIDAGTEKNLTDKIFYSILTIMMADGEKTRERKNKQKPCRWSYQSWTGVQENDRESIWWRIEIPGLPGTTMQTKGSKIKDLDKNENKNRKSWSGKRVQLERHLWKKIRKPGKYETIQKDWKKTFDLTERSENKHRR